MPASLDPNGAPSGTVTLIRSSAQSPGDKVIACDASPNDPSEWTSVTRGLHWLPSTLTRQVQSPVPAFVTTKAWATSVPGSPAPRLTSGSSGTVFSPYSRSAARKNIVIVVFGNDVRPIGRTKPRYNVGRTSADGRKGANDWPDAPFRAVKSAMTESFSARIASGKACAGGGAGRSKSYATVSEWID